MTTTTTISVMSQSSAIPNSPPAQTFTMRLVCGLLGVLMAVLIAGINENVTKIAMPDIQGALFIGHDEASWLTTLYTSLSVVAMAFTPWFASTFSIRLVGMWSVSFFMLWGFLCPFAPDLQTLMILRSLQGIAGGCLPPLLMTCALRFLPPNIKVYGLATYALTATFGPSIGTPLAAFWVDYFGWNWAFWGVIPFGFIAFFAISYGIPQDPLRLERFKQFDWFGLLLGVPAIVMLCIGILQGERLYWFNSPVITHLIVIGSFLLILFFINEWFHPLPFFKIQLLKNRNLSFALVTLGFVLFILISTISIPSSYLARIQDYRPLQTAPILLIVSIPQFIALPLVALICNIRRVDCRVVLAVGFMMLAYSCYLGSQLTSQWINSNFYWLAAIQIFAQPMAVLPILMLSTGQIHPTDGPFASALFNTTKGFAGVLASGVLDALTRTRMHYHSNMLVDQVGNNPLLSDGGAGLTQKIHVQASVLSSADLYLIVASLAVLVLVMIILIPTRIYPPRAVHNA